MSSDTVLGEGYSAIRLELGSDAEGPVVATLIHRDRSDDSRERSGDDRARSDHEETNTEGGARTGRSGERSFLPYWSFTAGRTTSSIAACSSISEREGMTSGRWTCASTVAACCRARRPRRWTTSADTTRRSDRALRIIGRDRPPILLAHSARWPDRRALGAAPSPDGPWAGAELPLARDAPWGRAHALSRRGPSACSRSGCGHGRYSRPARRTTPAPPTATSAAGTTTTSRSNRPGDTLSRRIPSPP